MNANDPKYPNESLLNPDAGIDPARADEPTDRNDSAHDDETLDNPKLDPSRADYSTSLDREISVTSLPD
jgi:hypothetical protein